MALLKLTKRISEGYGKSEYTTEPVLIETNQIIDIQRQRTKSGSIEYEYTEIQSVGAMITTNKVMETPDEIFKMYTDNSKKITK